MNLRASALLATLLCGGCSDASFAVGAGAPDAAPVLEAGGPDVVADAAVEASELAPEAGQDAGRDAPTVLEAGPDVATPDASPDPPDAAADVPTVLEDAPTCRPAEASTSVCQGYPNPRADGCGGSVDCAWFYGCSPAPSISCPTYAPTGYDCAKTRPDGGGMAATPFACAPQPSGAWCC